MTQSKRWLETPVCSPRGEVMLSKTQCSLWLFRKSMVGGWAAPHTERPEVPGEPLQSLALSSPTADARLVPAGVLAAGSAAGACLQPDPLVWA